MHESEITLATAVVTILATFFFFWTGYNVGRMRGKYGIKAPVMTGDPEFERSVRVQMNTLEWSVVFLPLLWLATIYFAPAMTMLWLAWLPPVFGLIWIAGRILYMNGYMTAPENRSTGFLISAIAVVGLLIMSLVGIVMRWIALSAV